MNDKDAVDAKAVNTKIKELKKTDPKNEELTILCAYSELSAKVKEYAKLVKELNAALDEACKAIANRKKAKPRSQNGNKNKKRARPDQPCAFAQYGYS